MKTFYEARPERLFAGRMTRYPFPLHVHEVVEIAYVTEGGCTMQIGEARYDLSPGDIAFVFPIVPHSYETIEPGTEGFAAFFPADTIAEFSHTFQTLLPVEPVLRCGEVPEEAWRVIHRLLEAPNEVYSPSRLALLHLLLADTLHELRFYESSAFNERGLASRVVRFVYDHACEKITLKSAARALGISVSHLSHLFSQQFRIGFRSFVNAVRVDRAQMLMRDPLMTLTRISDACGYENIRTFRRAFVSQTGMLPSACQQKIRDDNGITRIAFKEE